jgi:hypothetical protein
LVAIIIVIIGWEMVNRVIPIKQKSPEHRRIAGRSRRSHSSNSAHVFCGLSISHSSRLLQSLSHSLILITTQHGDDLSYDGGVFQPLGESLCGR